MDISGITQLIANIGFPIAMCIAFLWYINKRDTEHKEEVDGLRRTQEEQTQKYCDKLDEVKEALKENSVVMAKLLERLGGAI